jgi:hypothetical protein
MCYSHFDRISKRHIEPGHHGRMGDWWSGLRCLPRKSAHDKDPYSAIDARFQIVVNFPSSTVLVLSEMVPALADLEV